LQLMTDDRTYTAWLRANPHGWVINTARPPSASYLMLHRSSCWTINGRPTNGSSWTRSYSKVCSSDRRDLEGWAQREWGVTPNVCAICEPGR